MFGLDLNFTFISSDIVGIFSRSSIITGIFTTLARHTALDLLTIIWLENSELGTTTGRFSGLINNVDVSPISITFPSIDPACRRKELQITQVLLL
jgi:hypothetical protein